MFSAHCSTRNTFRSSNSCFFASSSGGQFFVSSASTAALAASRSFALTFSRERSHKKRHSSAALRRNRAPAGAQNKKSGIVPAHPAYIAPGTVTQEPSPVSHFNRQITVLCLDRPRNARRRKHLPGEKSPGFSFPARQETR